LIFIVYGKYLFLFGVFSTGSAFLGQNLNILIGFSEPLREIRASLVEKGKISKLALRGSNFADLPSYEPYYNIKTTKTGIPVLDQKFKSGRNVNTHNLAYLEIGKQHLKDSLYLLKEYPLLCAKIILNKFYKNYFKPAFEVYPFNSCSPNYRRILLSQPESDKIKKNIFTESYDMIYNKILYMKPIYYIISLPLLIFYSILLIIKSLHKKHKNTPITLTILYMSMTVMLVNCASALTWETSRVRFNIDSFYLIFLALFLTDIINIIKKTLKTAQKHCK